MTNATRKGDLEWPGWETFLFDIKRLGKELAPRLTFEQRPKGSTGVGTELCEVIAPDRGNSMIVRYRDKRQGGWSKTVSGEQWEMKLERKWGPMVFSELEATGGV